MILSVQMSMGQNTDTQQEDLVLADTLIAAYGGNPMDTGNQIADIVPKKGGPLFDIGLGPSYFDWKDKVYDKTGLRFGLSYKILYKNSSTVLDGVDYNAWSDWWGCMTKWTLSNRKKGNN